MQSETSFVFSVGALMGAVAFIINFVRTNLATLVKKEHSRNERYTQSKIVGAEEEVLKLRKDNAALHVQLYMEKQKTSMSGFECSYCKSVGRVNRFCANCGMSTDSKRYAEQIEERHPRRSI